MTLCRLCLRSVEKDQTVSTTNNQKMLERITECVSLEINLEFDFLYGLPSNVCKKCLEKLNDWHRFKVTCLKTDLLLKRGIQKAVILEKGSEKTACGKNRDRNGSYIQLLNQFREIRPKSEIINENIELVIETSANEARCEDNELLLDLKFDEDKPCIENKDENRKSEDEVIHIKKESDEDEVDYYGVSSVEFQPMTYTCEFCSKEFDMFLDYLEHQDAHDGQPVFKCDKCPEEVFTSKANLSEHESGHKIPCDLCGTMVLRQSMKAHRVRHTDRFKCKQCPYKFSNRIFLEKHLRAVHYKIKNEVCEVCGKCFGTNNSLRIHLQSHGERTYKCKVCDFAGKTSSSLLLHSSKHLRETHVCEICSKVFKSYRNLYDHLRRVHKAEKKHVCTWKQCQMKFIDKYMLRTHMRIHTGSRPYPCTKCDKKFIRSDSLKEHLQTHDRTVFYECKGCLKKFTTRRGKTRHKCVGSGSG